MSEADEVDEVPVGEEALVAKPPRQRTAGRGGRAKRGRARVSISLLDCKYEVRAIVGRCPYSPQVVP